MIRRLLSFTKSQRQAVLLLLLGIFLFQVLIFIWPQSQDIPYISTDGQLSLKKQYDSLLQANNSKTRDTIYPFNPNYMTDYRGYMLGLSIEELDRLYRFRKQGKYINSAAEFQEITGISDSVLAAIKPSFRFPDWIQKSTNSSKQIFQKINLEKRDLNTATAVDLLEIKGIGPHFSNRIIAFREDLGGFFQDDLLYDIYGLKPEVVLRVLEWYSVQSPSSFVKVDINQANVEDLVKVPYLNYHLATSIIAFRSKRQRIDDLKELEAIVDFPIEKLDRIALYLGVEGK